MKVMFTVILLTLLSFVVFAQEQDFTKLLIKPNTEHGLLNSRASLMNTIAESLGWGLTIKRLNNNLLLVERQDGFTLEQISNLLNNLDGHVEVFLYDHPEEPIILSDT